MNLSLDDKHGHFQWLKQETSVLCGVHTHFSVLVLVINTDMQLNSVLQSLSRAYRMTAKVIYPALLLTIYPF